MKPRNTRPGQSRAGHGKGKKSATKAKDGSAGPSAGSSGPRGGLGKRKTDNFNKFYNKKRNSAVKEAFRQEKKAVKRERKEAIERHFEEKRLSRGDGQQPRTGPDHRQRPDDRERRDDRPKPADRQRPSDRQPPSGHQNPADRERRARPGITGRPEHTGKAPGRPAPVLTGKAPGHPAKPAGPGKPQHAPAQGKTQPDHDDPDQLPLNKYIAHGGICSRRDAAELIRQGKVTVNGQPVTEPGTKVTPTDLVKVSGKKITISRNFVYILLNKPKDYITTTDDPQERKTVMDLIRPATTERVYPVGRLDRNTSGVLLLTNDGDLAQKLAHPSHQIKKIYQVTLDKALTRADFDRIINGEVVLEDGPAIVDVMAYSDVKDKTQIGLEIHSGRNRIVRRIFEHLGYDVRGLDRVMYAGLTKKNVQRGHWRLLSEKEIRVLKYLNSSIKGSPGRAKDLLGEPEPAPIAPIQKAVHTPKREPAPAQRPAPAPKREITLKRDAAPAERATPADRRPAPDRSPRDRNPDRAPRRDTRPDRDPSPRDRAPRRDAESPDRDRIPFAKRRTPPPGIRPKSRRPGKPRKPSARPGGSDRTTGSTTPPSHEKGE
jgi:23S rRNA pseudouridine2605 synthase